MDMNTFRQDESQIYQTLSPRFSVNLCGLNGDVKQNFLFKFIPGLKKHFKDFIHNCPIVRGAQLLISDRTLKQVPRHGSVGPIIPSGLYKFLFTMRTDQNLSLGSVDVRFQFRGF
jgi:hypothetical protein